LVVHLGDGGVDGGGVGDGLVRGAGGEQGGCREPVDRAGEAAAGLVDQRGGVIAYLGISRSTITFPQVELSLTRPRREGQKRQRRGAVTK